MPALPPGACLILSPGSAQAATAGFDLPPFVGSITDPLEDYELTDQNEKKPRAQPKEYNDLKRKDKNLD